MVDIFKNERAILPTIYKRGNIKMAKSKIKRTNKNTLCRGVWYATCNFCDKTTYRYHKGKVIEGKDKGSKVLFCHKCMKKHNLTYKKATSYVSI